MKSHVDAPQEIVTALGLICLNLPEVEEELAWVGTRWRVRSKTFAHVVPIDEAWPPAYARATGSDGPLVVLTFCSSGPELDVLRSHERPFFAPQWRKDVVGLVLDEDTDWAEVRELLTESYCALAPQTLAATVTRPG